MFGAGLDATPPLLVSSLCGVCDTKIQSSHFSLYLAVSQVFQYLVRKDQEGG